MFKAHFCFGITVLSEPQAIWQVPWIDFYLLPACSHGRQTHIVQGSSDRSGWYSNLDHCLNYEHVLESPAILHPSASPRLPFSYQCCSVAESRLSDSFLLDPHLIVQLQAQCDLQIGLLIRVTAPRLSDTTSDTNKVQNSGSVTGFSENLLWNEDTKRGRSCIWTSVFLTDSQNRWPSPKPRAWNQTTSRDMEVLAHEKVGKQWQRLNMTTSCGERRS